LEDWLIDLFSPDSAQIDTAAIKRKYDEELAASRQVRLDGLIEPCALLILLCAVACRGPADHSRGR